MVRVRDEQYDWRLASNKKRCSEGSSYCPSTAAIVPELRIGTTAAVVLGRAIRVAFRTSFLVAGQAPIVSLVSHTDQKGLHGLDMPVKISFVRVSQRMAYIRETLIFGSEDSHRPMTNSQGIVYTWK